MEVMARQPRVSLLLTFHNSSLFLQRAIDSALSQTYKTLELILFDDGSTDNSLEIAQRATSDQRVRLVQSSKVGRLKSLRQAHSLAAGHYVGWLDSDDFIDPTCVEKSVAALELNPEASFTYTYSQWLFMSGKTLKPAIIPYTETRLLTHFVTTHFRLIRQQSFKDAGGLREDFPIAIDYDLALRLEEIGSVVCVPEFLHTRTWHPQQMSSQNQSLQHYYSARAVRNALKRRGKDTELSLRDKFICKGSRYYSSFSLEPTV